MATQAIAQPTLTSISTVNNVRSGNDESHSRSFSSRTSIDITPFLTEKLGNESFLFKDSKYTDRGTSDYESDDEGVHFDENISKFDEVRNAKPSDANAVSLAEKLSGDLFSALGAFKFLTESKAGEVAGPSSSDVPSPPLSALELLEKGAELGSSRALYNIGVAYDRLKESKLAREYYKRASDLGHPLAVRQARQLFIKLN